MKLHIEHLIQKALEELQQSGELPLTPVDIQVDATKGPQHGDFATNIALISAKLAKKKPRDIAERIVNALPPSDYIERVEIAGPGFINFFLSPLALTDVVATVLKEKSAFGSCKIGREKRILVEFVSSNPTGPLHVGHGRHAAFGAVIANLLDTVGFKTFREYYVNDAGRQVDIVAVSLWLRYLELAGESIVFPANAYRGDYVIEIAKLLQDKVGSALQIPATSIFADLPRDEPDGGDKEIYIDAIIDRAKNLLGDQKYQSIVEFGLKHIIADMREDLLEFGVQFDNWFSEREFVETDVVDRLLEKMRDSGQVYEKEGALWFRSTNFGDAKDRVLVRSNGQRTYFANDVAYHLSKFDRGFDIAIDVFGADHHGYVPRMKAAVEASGINPERLIHVLVQFVTLYRGKEQVQMSTRAGAFVTLRELRKEVGKDAARFFYVMRKSDQPMDFDLELAKKESNENPVYYLQYAYARISSVFKQLSDRQLVFNEKEGLEQLVLLKENEERQLLNTLSRYPEVIVNAALNYEPHLLTNYLRDLAADFHGYYNSHQFIVPDSAVRNARLALVIATRQTLLNGFNILGISAPESM